MWIGQPRHATYAYCLLLRKWTTDPPCRVPNVAQHRKPALALHDMVSRLFLDEMDRKPARRCQRGSCNTRMAVTLRRSETAGARLRLKPTSMRRAMPSPGSSWPSRPRQTAAPVTRRRYDWARFEDRLRDLTWRHPGASLDRMIAAEPVAAWIDRMLSTSASYALDGWISAAWTRAPTAISASEAIAHCPASMPAIKSV
jgi:hypothetical protein